MIDKCGIQQTSDVLRFGLSVAKGFAFSAVDGKFTFTDLMYFKDAALTFTDALVDIHKVPIELIDLDADEMDELKKIAMEEFSIPFEGIENTIRMAIGIAMDIVKLVLSAKK